MIQPTCKNEEVVILIFVSPNANLFSKSKVTVENLEVLAQLANAEIARPDVMTRVRTWDLLVVCEFIFSGLPLHLRPKKKSDS
ncbi:hypothetical protein MTR_7g114450 [Medicago truncatula]|uniref:Uncharacterized protein n=1 Tax=Medicago truncatula TaxID=3880 RepID=G7L0S7_MEDTR|nr:hypothetical protein MTR_7g114450 [Medicago truncatula]